MNRYAAEVIGRNIGIAGTVAGVSGAVGNAIAKSSLPVGVGPHRFKDWSKNQSLNPLYKKTGLVVGAAIVGGGYMLELL